MSSGRKYAALPDLDPAPDIYETPELTDDTSTIPTSTAPRSESAASSYNDPGEDEAASISRRRIDADEARTHFLPHDAGRGDSRFTSRISSKRKSYQTSGRGRRKDVGRIDEADSFSDEDDESLEGKLARLRREVIEVKGEYERRKSSKKDGSVPTSQDQEISLDTLGQLLDDISIPGDNGSKGAASRLANKLGTAAKSFKNSTASSRAEDVQQLQEKPIYTMTYAPAYEQNSTLAKVTDFDARLTMLEAVLGVEAVPLPIQDNSPAKAVIPILNALNKQISTLSSSTDSSLDSVSRRVRQLTQDAEKLDEARKFAKAAQEEIDHSTSRRKTPSIAVAEKAMSDKVVDHLEQTSKINALYGTLSTIESLAPLLPPLLDRLRSLRYIHADAATASQSLAKVEARQEAMEEDIKGWREGLEKVERAMTQGEQTMNGNTKMVEGWVKELEDRMQKLGQHIGTTP